MQGLGSPRSSNEMSPYLGSKYASPISSRSPSPNLRTTSRYVSDDEISVGCPSPALHARPQEPEDYFKPLKKLKMVEERRISPTVEVEERPDGVKSFSIADILNHKPAKPTVSRIVRPWDVDPEMEAHQQRLESFHRHLKVQQLALLRPEFAAFSVSYTSETGSDRSSSVASDCCSPDIVSPSSVTQRQRHQHQQQQGKQPGATPLDALFQMTSKTFDSSAGENSAGRSFFHHNNILSTNWRSMRLKLPIPEENIGWRVEFRPMDVQMTDFENAAYVCFVVLLTRVVLHYKLNFLMPISKVDENFSNCQKRDAINSAKFWFRQDIQGADQTPNAKKKPSDVFVQMTMNEIMNGKGEEFPGVIPLMRRYLKDQNVDASTSKTLNGYFDLLEGRASGKIMTVAAWMRKFVTSHPEYKRDSVVSEKICYDLLKSVQGIQDGDPCPELLGQKVV